MNNIDFIKNLGWIDNGCYCNRNCYALEECSINGPKLIEHNGDIEILWNGDLYPCNLTKEKITDFTKMCKMFCEITNNTLYTICRN